MIAGMLYLPPDKNRLLQETDAVHTAEYKIDNRSVYNILDQICKDTELYPCIKQHKYKRDSRGAYYAIHSMLLGPNHINATASEDKLALHSLCMTRKLGKVCCLPCQVPYYPRKPYGIWVPRPQPRVKSLISIEWY